MLGKTYKCKLSNEKLKQCNSIFVKGLNYFLGHSSFYEQQFDFIDLLKSY
jgi:hypothetical protein